MMIAVFNYPNESLDLISIDAAYIEDLYSGDVERYLYEEHNYSPGDMFYMSGIKDIQVIDNDRLCQVL